MRRQDPLISPEAWNESEDFTLEDWQYDVGNNDTRLGFEDWKIQQKEAQAPFGGHNLTEDIK